MPAPETTADLVAVIRKSKLVPDESLETYLADPSAAAPAEFAARLRTDGLLTPFQADQLLRGRHKGFVLGKYRLLDRIGMGGMGQVYLAEHLAMRRRVAVKVLPPDRGNNPFARERFLREARATAAVEHPNLIRVFDVENDGDVYFLVMEYVDGVSLYDLVARRGPLDAARAAHYMMQAAAGLAALHDLALVHRDVKPANLLLDRAGVVRVLDLGLVRSELDDDELTRQEGAKLVGTADYLAPEQAVNCSKVDARADIYGLGATAYFLLTGTPPFVAQKLSQKLIAHQTEVAKPAHLARPGVSPEVSAVVSRMLAKLPSARPQSMVDVAALLYPLAGGPPPLPDPADFPERAGVSPPTGGLSFAHRLGEISFGLSRSGPRSGLSGSAVKLSPDVPPTTPSQAGQKTAAMTADETATKHPSPARPTPAPSAPTPPPQRLSAPIPLVAAARPEPAADLATITARFGIPAAEPAATVGRRWLYVLAAAVAASAVALGGWLLATQGGP